MKIVIDIPEEVFDEIYNKNYYSLKGKESLRIAVRNGTPLPKGHGRLIDINEITAFRELECNGHDVESLDEFTVIIEADKGGEQE